MFRAIGWGLLFALVGLVLDIALFLVYILLGGPQLGLDTTAVILLNFGGPLAFVFGGIWGLFFASERARKRTEPDLDMPQRVQARKDNQVFVDAMTAPRKGAPPGSDAASPTDPDVDE